MATETEASEKEYLGLTQDEWMVVAKTAITAAGTAMTTIKATKKLKQK